MRPCLGLSDKYIKHKSSPCSDIKTLEYVNLSNNRLKLFDPEAFSGQFPSFKELDLSHNELIVLRDQNFPSLSSMTKLDLRGNNILYLSPG